MANIVATTIYMSREELDTLVENLKLLQEYERPDGEAISLYGIEFPKIFEPTPKLTEVDIPVEIQSESEENNAGSEGQPTEETEPA